MVEESILQYITIIKSNINTSIETIADNYNYLKNINQQIILNNLYDIKTDIDNLITSIELNELE